VANPPKAGERPEILNQIAETARVRDIAEMVAKLFDAEVQMVANPRQEDAENELVVSNQKFKLLGLDPILLESAEGLFKEVTEIANKYLDRVDRSKVASKAYWNKARANAVLDSAPTKVGEAAAKA
jgi:UDP-sulfoquinovose synthase